MFWPLLKNRRLILFVLLGILGVVLGRWVVPEGLAVTLVVEGGYWVILVGFSLFVRAVWRVMRPGLKGWRPDRFDVGALALIVTISGLWQAHEPKGFKILADEVLLLGTSMNMHYTREVSYPIRATDVQGPFQAIQSVLDKRPFFFPFLVSLVHDFTGYRPSNPFYVNIVLGAVFLALMYGLGWRLAGTRWAGAALVLLWGGLPLLAQQTVGGGFDLLNLVMLATVLSLAWRFAAQPDAAGTEALCLGTVLLALTRYESVLFVFPVAGLLLWGWSRVGKITLTWPVWLTPILLLPYVLQNRIFTVNSGAWEMSGQGGGVVANAPFALHYLPDNLGHAAAFFFDTSGYQPSSLVFGVLGLLALPGLGIWVARVLRAREQQSPADVAVVAVALGLFAINALLFVYFWGQFDHPVIHRLSLPLHLLMALALVVVVRNWLHRRRFGAWKVLCGVALGGLLVQGLPAMAKRAYEHDYTPGVEMAWRREFIARYPARDYLFLDRDSNFWITQEIPATPIEQAKRREEGLAYHLRNHSFSAMYVFQRFKVDDQTGRMILDPADDPGPDFELQPVWEKRIATLLIGRISRVTAIHYNGKTEHATPYVQPGPGPSLTPAQLDKARAEYLDNWIKQLP
jgi:hypothetical protein